MRRARVCLFLFTSSEKFTAAFSVPMTLKVLRNMAPRYRPKEGLPYVPVSPPRRRLALGRHTAPLVGERFPTGRETLSRVFHRCRYLLNRLPRRADGAWTCRSARKAVWRMIRREEGLDDDV